jgi:phenylacetate-CoA ligase
VITAFAVDATFIRYDLEDIVVQDVEPCPCGDTGPRYTLLGRSADLVTVGGRQILPLDVQLAADDLGAPEFQVGRDSDGTTLQLQVEADGRGPELEAALSERLGVAVAVVEVPRGSLPRSTFKPRRVS